MSEAKKMMVWLAGVAGVAVIVVLTALSLKLIFKSDEKVPAAVAEAAPAVAAPAPAPVAQVVSVKPHVITVSTPKTYCTHLRHIVYDTQQPQSSGAGAVLGGITGGLLGSEVGGGNGRIVTSAAGAVIGAFTGDNMERSMNSPTMHTEYSTSCKTHQVSSTVQKGYEVTYTYQGTQGVVVMDNAPMIGSALPIPLH